MRLRKIYRHPQVKCLQNRHALARAGICVFVGRPSRIFSRNFHFPRNFLAAPPRKSYFGV